MTEQIRSALDSDVVKVVSRLALLVGLPWSVWVTKSLVEHNSSFSQGARFTAQDAWALESRIDRRFDALPPPDTRARIANIDLEIRELRTMLRAVADEFTRDFVRKDELPD